MSGASLWPLTGALLMLQELWCKKMPPTAKLFQVYKPQDKSVLDQPSAKLKLGTESMRSLIRTADSLGKLLQYRQQGFLPNARQQRMAGLAVIELAQAVRAVVSCQSWAHSLLEKCIAGWLAGCTLFH